MSGKFLKREVLAMLVLCSVAPAVAQAQDPGRYRRPVSLMASEDERFEQGAQLLMAELFQAVSTADTTAIQLLLQGVEMHPSVDGGPRASCTTLEEAKTRVVAKIENQRARGLHRAAAGFSSLSTQRLPSGRIRAESSVALDGTVDARRVTAVISNENGQVRFIRVDGLHAALCQ